jgi:hypothetical protein
MSTHDSSPDTAPGLGWSPQIDKMLADWCDEAKCFEWMHSEAYSRYSKRATAMTIGSNITISLTGIANLVVGATIPDTTTTSMIFGCVSIGIGIVNMIQQQFGWTELANNYKVSAKHWTEISRKMQEQVIIPPSGRKDCGTFLKYVKQDMALASEHNSSIPKDIRLKCFEKFNLIPNFNVPDICGQIEHTAVYLEEPLLSRSPIETKVPV